MSIASGPKDTKLSRSSSRRSPKELKYYLVDRNYRLSRSLGLTLENEELIRRRGIVSFTRLSGHPGFWEMPEPPCLRCIPEKGRMPRDLNYYCGFWLVSDRAKSVLESVDPAAFDFVKGKIIFPDDPPSSHYWFCDVLPIIDALDETESDARIEYERGGRKVYSLMGARRLIFKSERIGSAHIFRMAYIEPEIVCDEAFRIACKTAGLKGFSFEAAIRG